MVSVVVPTYQHAAYIERCLDGILMQSTNFPVEILIGEDESSDGTRAICQRYAEVHPERIKLFLGERKDVIHILGRPTGRANFIKLLTSAKARYIALCEGDDFWTDPLKLQKQVDFLEANPDYALCFHTVDVLGADGSLGPDLITRLPASHETIKDLAQHRNFMHTPSVVFRNMLGELPPEFLLSPTADYFMYMMLARHGKLKHLPDLMATYREGVGIWSAKPNYERGFGTAVCHLALARYFERTNGQEIAEILYGRVQKFVARWGTELRVKDLMALAGMSKRAQKAVADALVANPEASPLQRTIVRRILDKVRNKLQRGA